MASPKGKIFRLLSGFVLDDARVHTVQRIGSYQHVHLTCDVKAFAAGAKVQLLLPTDDTRTYTPIPAPDGMILLGHKHGDGPGSRWLRQVRTGDKLAWSLAAVRTAGAHRSPAAGYSRK